jgi:hypothetical protein
MIIGQKAIFLLGSSLMGDGSLRPKVKSTTQYEELELTYLGTRLVLGEMKESE